MKKTVKATLSDFLAKKLKKEEDQNKTLDISVSSMGGKTFSVKKPTDNQIMDFIEELGDTKSAKKAIEETMKLIYRNCPDLQDKELHEALEIKDPYSVMDVLFDFKDKQEIMEQFNAFTGFKADNIDEELKNS